MADPKEPVFFLRLLQQASVLPDRVRAEPAAVGFLFCRVQSPVSLADRQRNRREWALLSFCGQLLPFFVKTEPIDAVPVAPVDYGAI